MENNKNCIFCKIVKNEIPCFKICENDKALCFLDVNPISDGHCIVIPKKHFRTLSETDDEYLNSMINLSKIAANKLLKSKLKPWGFNYLTNEEIIAGQEIFHTHMHVIPKYAKHEGLNFKINKDMTETEVEKTYKKIATKKFLKEFM